jgi:hypothetical protein
MSSLFGSRLLICGVIVREKYDRRGKQYEEYLIIIPMMSLHFLFLISVYTKANNQINLYNGQFQSSYQQNERIIS